MTQRLFRAIGLAILLVALLSGCSSPPLPPAPTATVAATATPATAPVSETPAPTATLPTPGATSTAPGPGATVTTGAPPSPELTATATSPPLRTATPKSLLPQPDHVVVVMEENHGYSAIIGSRNAPYLNTLAQQGALFSNSHGITHPSQPNYLALFSGSTQGVNGDQCLGRLTDANLGSELIAAGRSFGGYSEDLPALGSLACTAGRYGRKHSPWVNFSNVPTTTNHPFGDFPSDYSTLPTIAFVIPNLDNDMHDGSVQRGDTWLQLHLGGYVQWAGDHNSLLIVQWDEDNYLSGNRIPTIIVGAGVRAGTYAEAIDHYTLLRTVEDMYGLPPVGNSARATPITDIWTTGSGP